MINMIYADCFEQSETDEDLRDAVFSAFGVQINADEFNNLMSVIKNTVIDIDLTDTDKNNLDLVKWAEFAYDNHWGYVWGSHGQVLTEKELSRLKGVFGSHVTDKEEDNRFSVIHLHDFDEDYCITTSESYDLYGAAETYHKYIKADVRKMTLNSLAHWFSDPNWVDERLYPILCQSLDNNGEISTIINFDFEDEELTLTYLLKPKKRV